MSATPLVNIETRFKNILVELNNYILEASKTI